MRSTPPPPALPPSAAGVEQVVSPASPAGGTTAPAPVRFLDLLDATSRAQALDLGRTEQFDRGMVVFREGDIAHEVALVETGWALVTMGSGAYLQAVAHRGDLLGVDLLGRPRPATVIAGGALAVRMIPGRLFQGWMAQHPAAWEAFPRTQCAQRRLAEQRRRTDRGVRLNIRLARALRDLAGEFGRDDGTTTPVVPLSQRQLAEFVGSSEQTIGPVLRGLRNAGLCRRGPDGWTVDPVDPVDPVGLDQLGRSAPDGPPAGMCGNGVELRCAACT